MEENLLVKQFTFGHLTNEDDELSLGETKLRIKLSAVIKKKGSWNDSNFLFV